MYGMLVEENTKMFSLSFSFSFSRRKVQIEARSSL